MLYEWTNGCEWDLIDWISELSNLKGLDNHTHLLYAGANNFYLISKHTVHGLYKVSYIKELN